MLVHVNTYTPSLIVHRLFGYNGSRRKGWSKGMMNQVTQKLGMLDHISTDVIELIQVCPIEAIVL